MAGSTSVADALAVLEEHAQSARAHSAIKTLRTELGGGDASKSDGPESPGQKAAKRSAPGPSFGANASKAAAFSRMKGGKS